MEKMAVESTLERLFATEEATSLIDELSTRRKPGYRVLDLLVKNPDGVTPSRLASECGVSTSRMTVLLNHLQFLGFARRTRNKSDQRSFMVTALPKGRALLEENKKAISKAVNGLVAILSEEELAELVRLMGKLSKKKGED